MITTIKYTLFLSIALMALLSACSSAETPVTKTSASGEGETESTAASALSENEELSDAISASEGEAKLNESSVNCDLRSSGDSQETSIDFTNASDKAVILYWLNSEGKELFIDILRSGENMFQDTFVNHAWCIRDYNSEQVVMSIVATEDRQEVIISNGSHEVVAYTDPLKGKLKPNDPSVNCTIASTDDSQETSIEFFNASDKTIAIYWLSYGGQEIFHATLEPGQSNLQHTFVTHPWCVRELESGRSVMSVIATEDSQKIDIRF